jgi:hypothetical protein
MKKVNKRIIETIKEYLANRPPGLYTWNQEINRHITTIEIKSTKPISINSLALRDVNIQLATIDSSPPILDITSSQNNQGHIAYRSKWNKAGEYFLRLSLPQPVWINSIEIETDAIDCEWFFTATISTSNTETNQNLNYEYHNQISWDNGEEDNHDLIKLYEYASYRKSPEIAFNLFSNAKLDFPDDFEEISSLLQNLISPHTLTSHGYKKSLDFIDQNKLFNGLGDFVKKSNDAGYKIFAASGTLLGAVRDSKLISHDDDVDFGVLLNGNNLDEIIQSMKDFENYLKTSGQLRVGIFSDSKLYQIFHRIKERGESI